jgi:hypothetical protein
MAEVTTRDGTSVTWRPHSIQLLNQQLIHDLRISLSFGRLHHLPDKESDHGLLAGPVLFKLLGVRGENFVDNLL